ncbi:hypothetical protein JAB1_57910 [Janthinobacterium sp. MP5059B]|nr:hypothetical protein JAB1_57910 [Janthinobacterium sp. MP5059B]
MQDKAVDGDGFACSGVLVGKAGIAARHAELVVAQRRYFGRARQGGARRGVVDFIRRGHASDGDAGLADVGRDVVRLHQHIVGRIRALQGKAIEGNGLGAAGVLVGKRCAAAGDAQFVVAQRQHGGRARQGGGRGGVIHFGCGSHASDGDAGLADVGRDVARLHQYIVGRIRTLQAVAINDDGLALACVLVGKAGHAAGHAQLVATQRLYAGFARQGGAGGGVIDFIRRAHASDHHAGLADVGRDVVRLYQHIVGRIRALQDVAINDDSLAHAGVLVGKTGGASGYAELVIAQCLHAGRARQGGAGGGVIDFIGRSHALHIQRGAVDGGAVLAALQGVVAGLPRAAVRQRQRAVCHGLFSTRVFVVEDTATRQQQVLALHQAVQCQQTGRHAGAAVIGARAVQTDDGPVDRQGARLQIDVIPLLAGIQVGADGVVETGIADGAVQAIV